LQRDEEILTEFERFLPHNLIASDKSGFCSMLQELLYYISALWLKTCFLLCEKPLKAIVRKGLFNMKTWKDGEEI
jgi:hypothetical protein